MGNQKPGYKDLEKRIYELENQIHELKKPSSSHSDVSISEKRYRELFENMNTGFVLFKVVTDDKNIPIDLIIVLANRAFELTTGLKLKEVMGKRLTQVLQGIENDEADWIGTYGRIALTGEAKQFESGSELLGYYYNVSAYQSEPDYCAVTFLDITQQKKAENALRESESRLSKAQQISKIGDFTWDVDSGKVTWSDEMYHLLGYQKTDKIDFDEVNRKIHHPADLDRITKWLEESLDSEKGELIPNEYRLVKKNGKIIFARTIGIIQRENGKAKKVFATVQDITEQKIIEEEKQLTEEKYRKLFDYVPDGILIADHKSYYLDANQSLCRMLGYSRDQIIGMHAKDIVVPTEAKYIKPALNKITSNQKYKREWQFKRKDGSTFFADVMVTVMPGGNLLAMVHDITERKKAEKEIFAESRLNESILTSMLDGFILADTEGKLQRVNPAYCNMIGYSESELLSMNIRDLEVSIPEKEMSRRIESMVKKGSDRFETKHKRKDGKTIFLNVSILIIQSENKNMVAAFVQDISESKRNEQLLQQKTEEIEAQNEEYLQVNEELRQTNEELVNAKDKAEESDKLKTAFLQNMSHEIRTPMNAIMGFSDLMVQHLNDKEKLKSFTQIVSQRSNDLLNVLDDILDISRIESGQLPIHVEECNLDDLFLSLSGFFSERKRNMGKQHIQLSLQNHCNDTENLILTDGVKLRQIFINLLSNALKFTHEGVIEGGCRYNEDHQLQFYVSDTGIGIPHDKQDRVFERFYQVLLDRNIGGTGLGLPIVKGLVELLGGKIELVSEPGKGSVFTFSINYKKSKPSDDRKTSVMDTEVFDFSDKTILIVEDDPYNSEYLKEIISATDAKILHSFSGNESVQMAISEQVDIVLMDVRLPDMDGYEATRQIINLKPQTKIIAQTAYAQQGEKLKAHEAGCIDYISKPTKKKQLLTLIKKHLQS